MKVKELSGSALDEWVARAEGLTIRDGVEYDSEGFVSGLLKPYSTDWAHGGPIIQREGISLMACTSMMPPGQWDGYNANNSHRTISMWGETSLEAAMRCYVASQFGKVIGESH
jgi:hypothetical protein